MQQLNWNSPSLASLRPLLLPPVFPNDEDKTRLARGVHSVLLATSLILILYSLAILLVSQNKLTGLGGLAITFGTMLPLILLNRLGKTRLVSIIYLIYFWILISVTLLVSGGLSSVAGILYIPMITLALLFLGWRASLASFILTLIYTFSLATTSLSKLPNYFPPTTLGTWFILTIGIVMILTPIYQMQRELVTMLHKARKQLAEQQKEEDILKDSEERFRLISTISSDYTFSTRFNGPTSLEHTVYGGAFETITGYTPEEFDKVGGWLAVVYPDDLAQDAHDMANLRENKTVISELRIIRKDGQVRWVRTYGYPIWDAAEQKLIGIYGAVQDINERKLTEEALQESEERFRLISSITSDYTYVSRFNAEGKLQVKVVTGAFSNITGYTQEEFVKLGGWLAILHPDDLDQNARDMEKLRRNEAVVTEVRIFNKSGELRWVRMYGYPVWDTANNQLIGANGAVQDITDRKLAEQALVESENRYRLVSETISDYAYAYDIHPDGSFTAYWITEDSFMRLTGYTWIETGTTFNLYHPDDVERVKEDVRQTVAGNATSGDYRIITKSGETRWVSINRQVEWDENEKRFVRFYGAAQDITERKQAESALAKESKLLRTVIDQQPDNIFVKDRQSKFLLNNTESMRILGVSRQEDLLGKDDFDFLPTDLAQNWFVSQQQVMQSGKPVINREVFQPWNEGKRRWVLLTSIPLRDEQGNVTGLLGIDRDISEQKRAEESIREKEAFLRVLLDATTDVVFLMTLEGRFLTVNKPMAASMGTTVENLIGRNGFDFLPSELREERRAHFNACVQTRQPVRWEDRTANGWWDNTIYPVLTSSGEVESFAVYSVDITERKRLAAELQRYATQLEQMVEERTIELRRAKEQIELILNNTRDAIALAQANGDIETRNPAFISMFGDQVSNWIERLMWVVTSDDQCASVGKALVNTIHNQAGQRVELQIVSENGRNKDIDLAFIPVRLTDNQDHSGVLVSAHDITHIKQIERFKTQFIDDAVHDLATPITGLMNRLYLLKRSPEKLDDHLHKLENQVGHLRNLLDDLRSLSQSDRGQLHLNLELTNVNQVVARVFDTYEPVAISKGQTLILVTTPNLPEIQLDNRQMERVFVNLVANAINYTPNNKSITVQTALEEENVLFSVADQGIGISPIDLPHIFERFYRAQDARSTQSSGTGLGLAIVKEIVETHGGSVTATSELGKGSTFTVRLPINPDC